MSEHDLEKLREDIRSTLAIHVDNRADVPRILKLVMTSIKERMPCHSNDKSEETRKGA